MPKGVYIRKFVKPKSDIAKENHRRASLELWKRPGFKESTSRKISIGIQKSGNGNNGNKKKTGIFIPCGYCANDFYVRKCSFGKNKFCSNKCKWKSMVGKKLPLEQAEKHRNNLLKSIRKNKGTDIEIFMKKFFEYLKVETIPQVPIHLPDGRCTFADLYLPEGDMYVFCDGDYWHSFPTVVERDKRNNDLMNDMGISFIRIKGNDILQMKKNVEKKIDSIQQLERAGVQLF